MRIANKLVSRPNYALGKQIFFLSRIYLSLLCCSQLFASQYYEFTTVAQSNPSGSSSAFASLGEYPSIADDGTVAFFGKRNGGGEGIYVGTGAATLKNITANYSVGATTFGHAVQINNQHEAVVYNDTSAFGSRIYVWDTRGILPPRLVASGGIASSDTFGDVFKFPTINDNHQVVFSARPKNLMTLVLATMNLSGGFYTATFSAFSDLRPMIDSFGRAAVRVPAASSTSVRLYANNVQAFASIASAGTGYTLLGQSPGVTDDGTAVAFVGNRGNGLGVFLSLTNFGGGRSIFRVAGENTGSGGPNPELGTNSSGAPVFFSSFDPDVRIGVIHFSTNSTSLQSSTFLVSFSAIPSESNGPGSSFTFTNTKGLWVARVDLDASSVPGIAGLRPCIQVGDQVGGAPLLDFSVFDPISKISSGGTGFCDNSRWDHRIVFWASTTSGTSIQKAESIAGKISFLQAQAGALLYAPSDDIDSPLRVKPDFALLQNQPRVEQGLVADGVTPLILQFRVLQTPLNPTAFTISFDTEGGSISNLTDHLWVLGGNTFVQGNQFVLSSINTTGFAYISGINSEDVNLDPNSQAVTVKATIESAPGTGCPQEFKIAKPPVALVHGYNADSNTWSPQFLASLYSGRPAGFIQATEYGVKRSPGQGPDKTENTFGNFRNLAWLLNAALLEFESRSTDLHKQWAFTRYDVVAHSQGGVLMRFLSLANGPSWQKPSGQSNYYRGRFQRVITINSPHNGSVIPYYLKQRPDLAAPLLRLARPFIGYLLQEKFYPFGEQIANANVLALDTRVGFHTLRTSLEGGDPPAGINCLRNPYSIYGLELCLPGVANILLPHGSDGVVDFDGMTGGGVTKRSSITGVAIAHSGPDLFFGVSPDSTATKSSVVANRVVALLNGGTNDFGPFVNPGYDAIKKAQIDVLLLTFKIIDLLDIIKKVVAPSPGPSDVSCFDFVLQPRATEPVNSAVQWLCEVYGTNGVTTEGTSITVDPIDSKKVNVCVDDTVKGTVVLYGTYISTNSTLVYAMPVIVVEHAVGSNMVGIAIDPSEFTLSPGDTVYPTIWGVFDNGQRSQLYIPPNGSLVLTSSDNSVTMVTSNAEVRLLAPGTASITAAYAGFTNQMTVTVVGTITEPVLSIVGNSAGTVLVTLAGSAGRNHVIETSADLMNWQPISTNLIPASGSLQFGDTIMPGSKTKFYRAVLVP